MNKQQILEEINKTKEHLANMEKMLAECEYERWKPKDSEVYWYVNSRGESCCSHLCLTYKTDIDRYQNFNCFQTHEQVQAEAEKILVRRMLEDIARRLNKGEKIDWEDDEQVKYSINFDVIDNEINLYRAYRFIAQGTVYCLDMNFHKVAIQEIGEERLKSYLRGE